VERVRLLFALPFSGPFWLEVSRSALPREQVLARGCKVWEPVSARVIAATARPCHMHESACSTFHGVAKRSMSAPPVCYRPSDLPAVQSCHATALAAVSRSATRRRGVWRSCGACSWTMRPSAGASARSSCACRSTRCGPSPAAALHQSIDPWPWHEYKAGMRTAQCNAVRCVAGHERRVLKRPCMAWPVAMAATRGLCAGGGGGRGRGRGGQQRAGCAAGAQPAARHAESGPVRRARQAQQRRVAARVQGLACMPPSLC